MLSEKAGLYFKSLGDQLTQAAGLDLLLSDLNSGNAILRNQVLKTLNILMI